MARALGIGAALAYLLIPPTMEVAAQCSGTCEGDFNGDGRVTVGEIITSVNNSLGGCAGGMVFFEDFEQTNCLRHWVIGGRRAEGTNTANCVERNDSARAHLFKSSFTEIELIPRTGPFSYTPNLIFEFELEVDVKTSPPPSPEFYGWAGVSFIFLDDDGRRLGNVTYAAATTSYPVDRAAMDQTQDVVIVGSRVNRSFTLPVAEMLERITIDEELLAAVDVRVFAYSSTRPNPTVSAEIWFDNLTVRHGAP